MTGNPLSLMTYIQKKAEEEEEGQPITDMAPEEFIPEDDFNGFQIKLRKKRRAAQLRQMLEDSGYGELAKMLSIRERGG